MNKKAYFEAEEATGLIHTVVKVDTGFGEIPVDTTGWVIGLKRVKEKCYVLQIEFYFSRAFGRSAHVCDVNKNKFAKCIRAFEKSDSQPMPVFQGFYGGL